MNKEYIKREDISKFANKIKDAFAPLHRPFIDAIVYYLTENIPAAEVTPIKHGTWLDMDPGTWECSECHYEVERWNNTPYCPVCSAKMN